MKVSHQVVKDNSYIDTHLLKPYQWLEIGKLRFYRSPDISVLYLEVFPVDMAILIQVVELWDLHTCISENWTLSSPISSRNWSTAF